MTQARSLLVFILATIGAFVYLCNAIPQIKTEPIAAEAEIGASPEELVAAGESIFMSDRAQCLTCHSLGEDPKARCPDQEGLGRRAPKRRPGMSAAEYLVESAYNPNAYVVPGYPTNQMTPINKPPIALSDDEILAVLSFLTTLGGRTDRDFVARLRKAQEPWRRGLVKPEEVAERASLPILPGDEARGRDLFGKLGCPKCHGESGQGGDIGPDLDGIGSSQGPQYILESILDPSAVIVRGYKPIVVQWKQEGRPSVQGKVVQWIPDKETPSRLRLSVDEAGRERALDIDVTQIASAGDTTVVVESDGEAKPLRGDLVSGDAKTGVTLRFLEDGGWMVRRIPPESIVSLSYPASPMPANYAELMTPRDTYDLLSYLLSQTGRE